MKSVPSRIGLLLDLPVKKLEQVVYFASYIITDIYEDKREEAIKNLEERYKVTKVETQKEIQKEVNELKLQRESGELTKKKFEAAEHAIMSRLEDLDEEFGELKKGLTSLSV